MSGIKNHLLGMGGFYLCPEFGLAGPIYFRGEIAEFVFGDSVEAFGISVDYLCLDRRGEMQEPKDMA